MHELSIAMSIIELAEEESARRGGTGVQAIHLRLGPLSGVVRSALESSYELAREQSAVAGSRLVIEETPIVIYCPHCQAERTLKSMQRFCCPQCDTPTAEVRRGRELEVTALELEE